MTQAPSSLLRVALKPALSLEAENLGAVAVTRVCFDEKSPADEIPQLSAL